MNNTWHGIMKVLDVRHCDRNGKILWQQKNILNLLHAEGEEFILRAAFTGGRISDTIPEYYYLGLDARSTPLVTDTMDNIIYEPSDQFGYQRQSISSANEFIIAQESGHYIASSPIIAFRASNGSWGPITNLFLTDRQDNAGNLIATTQFDSQISVADGDSITMRIALMLKDCPAT
jgi:hypothetical protein